METAPRDDVADVPPRPPARAHVNITMPPSIRSSLGGNASVEGGGSAMPRSNKSSSGQVVWQIPLAALRGQAQHVMSPRPGDGAEDICSPPKFMGPSLPIRDCMAAAAPLGQQQRQQHFNYSKFMDHEEAPVDMSHLLPPTSTVRSLLTGAIDVEVAGDMIRGALVTKHNAAGGTARRRIYFNFNDGTVRVQQTFPFIQYFIGRPKGVYSIYKCYVASPWEGSNRGREKMLRNKSYVDPSMKDRTLSLVVMGGSDYLVVTFDKQADYENWLGALQRMQAVTTTYFSYFASRLGKETCRKTFKRLNLSQTPWASMASKVRNRDSRREDHIRNVYRC